MRNSYTLPQLFRSGYNLSDIDDVVRAKLGTFGRKTGKTVVVIADKISADNFVADKRENESYRRR